MRHLNEENIDMDSTVKELSNPSVNLSFVLACYEGGYKRFFEVSKAMDGKLMSFVPVDKDFLKKLISRLSLVVGTDNPFEKKMKADKPFFKPVLWVSEKGFIAYTDEAHKEISSFYAGKPVVIRNVPRFLYVASKDQTYVYEEVLTEKGEVRYVAANLPNISSNSGSVCTGNAVIKVKNDWVGEIVEKSYISFWNSSFTSHSDSTMNDWKTGEYKYRTRNGVSKRFTLKEIMDKC